MALLFRSCAFSRRYKVSLSRTCMTFICCHCSLKAKKIHVSSHYSGNFVGSWHGLHKKSTNVQMEDLDDLPFGLQEIAKKILVGFSFFLQEVIEKFWKACSVVLIGSRYESQSIYWCGLTCYQDWYYIMLNHFIRTLANKKPVSDPILSKTKNWFGKNRSGLEPIRRFESGSVYGR